MSRVSRRRVLEAAGVAGLLGLAGCNDDGADGGGGTVTSERATATATATATPTRTPTPTDTPTATPHPTATLPAAADGPLGFEPMLRVTPAHPDSSDSSDSGGLWARYVDAGRVLAEVDDGARRDQLREGWLGSGPPRYTDSDAFELVYLQPSGLSNVTFGFGAFSTDRAVRGMDADGWKLRRDVDADGFDVLEYGGYTAAVGAPFWVVVGDPDPALAGALAGAIGTDPFTTALDDVDVEAVSRAAGETGEYHVLERSSRGEGYAAGITLDFDAYVDTVGVMHYAAGRGTEWTRVERHFWPVPGEIHSEDFGDEFR